MPYKSHTEWAKKADLGEIYSGEDHPTVVKLCNKEHEVEEFKVQIYGDGFCHFYYGIDFHGVGLYYVNGDWIPYQEIESPHFPEFVELEDDEELQFF